MFIKCFEVQGFKSLANIQLTDLDAINVFHGLNDVGKSNIMAAIALYLRLLPEAVRSLDEPEDTLALKSGSLWTHTETIFRQPKGREIVWQADLRLSDNDQFLSPRLTLTHEAQGELLLRLDWGDPPPPDEVKQQLVAELKSGFNRIEAQRRFSAQWLSGETPPIGYDGDAFHHPIVRPDNLRQALLDAALGQDWARRQRFRTLVSLLNDHFGVGELEIALGDRRPLPRTRSDEPTRYEQEILVWFLRSNFPQPLRVEDVGSGVRQIILILAQMLLNPARIIGIEEPEMNLNPEWQIRLMSVFRELVGPEPGQVDQIFITSHSPEFESAEHFYDVTYRNGETRIERLPLDDRRKYFPILGMSEQNGEDLGPYLNSRGQIKLPQRVIDDLNLAPREPVFFYQDEDGHWRLRTKDELLALMETTESETEATNEDADNRIG